MVATSWTRPTARSGIRRRDDEFGPGAYLGHGRGGFGRRPGRARLGRLPHAPDWRWLLERSDSPWYPTMRLFRQETARRLGRVFAEIAAALRQRCAAGKATPTTTAC